MSDELTVANRNESWLKGIADGDTDSLEPMTHKELWYKAIADREVPDFLHPVTHEELWLQKIAESGGGGKSLPRKDVNFVDYDGTVVASYTAAEFDALTELPKNPTHDDLTAQGWNMTLAESKAQVAASGKCDIGQMYVSADGKTRLYIHIEDIARNKLPLYWSQTVANGVEIDWGDGSEPYTVSGTGAKDTTHTYAAAGDYVITLDAKEGDLSFTTNIFGSGNDNRVYCNFLKKVILGSVTSIGTNAFYNCYSLASVVIPSSVTSIGNSAFNSCSSLASIVIPSGVTSIGNSAFNSCSSLASIVIPSGVTSIGINAFYNCYSLASVTIPSGVTSIETSTFQSCYSLASVMIPSGVTSIGANAFQSCYSLASVMIPSGVTSIGNNAFSSCFGVAEYHVKATTPPTAGTTIFKSLASDCKIYVPSASVDTYKAASGWSTYASQIYGE